MGCHGSAPLFGRNLLFDMDSLWRAPKDRYHVRGHKKLAQWRLRLSESEFDIIHHVDIMQQAAESLLRIEIKRQDRTSLHDEVLVLIVS